MPDETTVDLKPRIVKRWPMWKGTPLDLIMYSGYLYGRDILMGAPWIAYSNSVRLGAGTGLSLKIDEYDGLILEADAEAITSYQEEVMATIVHTLDSLIERGATISFGNIMDDNMFLCNLNQTVARLRAFASFNQQTNT